MLVRHSASAPQRHVRPPVHVMPPEQVPPEQVLPQRSEQLVPSEAMMSGGHEEEEPLQLSERSQSPLAARHTVPALA